MPIDNNKPPFSRVFLTAHADMTEPRIREVFDKFGPIEDVWPIRPKPNSTQFQNGPPPSLWYIKFEKSSSALLAVEDMNNKIVDQDKQPLKVILASNRLDTVDRGRDGTDHLNRIFMVVKETDSVDMLREEFKKYGVVTDCFVLRNKYAYITYSRAAEAALAIEGCDESKSPFKPTIAEPRRPKKAADDQTTPDRSSSGYRGERDSRLSGSKYRYDERGGGEDDYGTPYGGGGSKRAAIIADNGRSRYDDDGRVYYSAAPLSPQRQVGPASARYGRPVVHSVPTGPVASVGGRMPEGFLDLTSSLINNPTRCTKLFLKVNYPLGRESVFKLANLMPTLEHVELHKEATAAQKTIALICYENPTAAALAWQKFQEFEYPPNSPIRIRYADAGFPVEWQIEFGLRTGYPFPPSSSMEAAMLAAPQPAAIAVQPSPMLDYPMAAAAHQQQQPQSGMAMGGQITVYNGPAGSTVSGYGTSQDQFYQNGRSATMEKNTIALDPPKPILPRGTPYADRCFFYTSNRLAQTMLEEIFSSFGDLIDVYYLGAKNCGYALYGTVQATTRAIEKLNGEVCYGEHFKVCRADPDPRVGGDA